MVHAAIRLGVLSLMVADIFATPTFASAQSSNSDHGQTVEPVISSGVSALGETPQNSSDETSPLVVTGDFNRDGIQDIAKITWQASNESDDLIVSLGQADGTFKTMASVRVSGHTHRAIVSGDFNNDGILDLIVGDEDGTLTLLFGDGTGRFNSVHEVAHVDSVISIAVADFNNDGILDIAVSDWRASSVTVMLGVGNGSFGHGWSFPLRMRGTTPHIAAADFDGDGVPDLAVIYDQEDGDTFDVMLGNGNGTFTIAPDRGFVRNPNSHCNTL